MNKDNTEITYMLDNEQEKYHGKHYGRVCLSVTIVKMLVLSLNRSTFISHCLNIISYVMILFSYCISCINSIVWSSVGQIQRSFFIS